MTTKTEWPEYDGRDLLLAGAETVDKAQMFCLSEAAERLYAQALNVQTLLSKIETRVKAEIKEGEDILTANLRWLAWAAKAANLDLQAISRNTRAKLPR